MFLMTGLQPACNVLWALPTEYMRPSVVDTSGTLVSGHDSESSLLRASAHAQKERRPRARELLG